MAKERFKLMPAVCVILKKDNKIFLLRTGINKSVSIQGEGLFYADGHITGNVVLFFRECSLQSHLKISPRLCGF